MRSSERPHTGLPYTTATLLLALVQAHPSPSHALQIIEAQDGVAVEAIVSRREPTRIRIEGAAITDVFGQIHSSHCGAATPLPPAPPAVSPPLAGQLPPGFQPPSVNPAGDVAVECDRDKGEIYVRPVGDSPRPINLFVASAHGTYTLLLRRADTPADTIVLRDRTAAISKSPSSSSVSAGPAPSHVRTMKALLVAMATDRLPADIRVEEAARPIQLWAEARVMLQRLYEGRGFIAERYSLQNISAAPMVLAEQEFDRPDSRDGSEVTGVAIERHVLRPGEATTVYVLRRGGRP